MGETQKHVNLIIHTVSALTVFFADRPDVYVAGNNFIYYEEGNNKARVSPDTYVVFGVGNQTRDSYFVWREGGKRPDVVFEYTSRKTRYEDTRKKLPLYRDVLRVSEYFQFDPTGDYLKPRLQGLRLVAGEYRPIEPVGGRLASEVLGLLLEEQGVILRLYDPAKGEYLPTLQEQTERAERADQRADAAEREVERLRAELARLRAAAGP